MLQESDWFAAHTVARTSDFGDSYHTPPEGRLTSRQSELIEARIEQNLGTAAGGMFTIVWAGQLAPGVQAAALLIADHLPILMPVYDDKSLSGKPAGTPGVSRIGSRAGCVFMVEVYDVYGRRVPSDEWAAGSGAKHHRLSEALMAAELGFRLLRHHSRTSHAQRFYGQRIGHLPDEQWLHEQLCGQVSPYSSA